MQQKGVFMIDMFTIGVQACVILLSSWRQSFQSFQTRARSFQQILMSASLRLKALAAGD